MQIQYTFKPTKLISDTWSKVGDSLKLRLVKWTEKGYENLLPLYCVHNLLQDCTARTTISGGGNETASMYNRTSGALTGSVSRVLASSSTRWSPTNNSLPR